MNADQSKAAGTGDKSEEPICAKNESKGKESAANLGQTGIHITRFLMDH